MSNTLEDARRIVARRQGVGQAPPGGPPAPQQPALPLQLPEAAQREPTLLGRITTVNGQWNRSRQDLLTMPAKYTMPPATLEKYGYRSMEQFLNWRWYRGLGGGPIVDLGSHQIDIFNWFLGARPASVMASGGTDYYSKDTHEWYDTVMAVYEYADAARHRAGVLPDAHHQRLRRLLRAVHGRPGVARDLRVGRAGQGVPRRRERARLGFAREAGPADGAQGGAEAAAATVVLDVRETAPPPSYALPVQIDSSSITSRTSRTSSTPSAAGPSSPARAKSATRRP